MRKLTITLSLNKAWWRAFQQKIEEWLRNKLPIKVEVTSEKEC